jgi:hypothetical protein
LLDFGLYTRKKAPGLGLVTQRMDPLNLRRHQSFLTSEGRALVHRVLRVMKGARS